jgi:hypothetical protein
MALYAGLGTVFPRGNNRISYLRCFVRYPLIGSWVTLFGPLVFARLKLADPLIKLSVKV